MNRSIERPDHMPAPLTAQQDFFGHAARSFAQPGKAEGRIGIIDAGSNSVRLVVYEGGMRSPAIVHNEKVMCALGARLLETGALDPEGKARALAAMRRFAALAERLDVSSLAAVATAAIRDASDGAEFRWEVARDTGIRLAVASGEDEAQLSAKGVLFGNPGASGIVVDLGGASMELCSVHEGRIGPGVSMPIGPLRLRAMAARGADPEAAIRSVLAELDPEIRIHGHRLHLVGGAWRALARLQMERTDYPLKVLHEYTIEPRDARDLINFVAATPVAELCKVNGVSEARAPILPLAGHLLAALLDSFDPREIMVSAFGLREGVCLDHMPTTVRNEDPLIAACIDQERRRSRAPGFGAELGDWLIRLLPPRDAEEERLMRAASFLVDVNWRTHPELRVAGSWETVTRVALTDIGHRQRVMLGAILSLRHKRGKKTLNGIDAARLILPEERDRAEQIGLALRLGIDLAAGAPGVLNSVVAEVRDGRLELTLGIEASELAGEEVDRRLGQLAKSLGLKSASDAA